MTHGWEKTPNPKPEDSTTTGGTASPAEPTSVMPAQPPAYPPPPGYSGQPYPGLPAGYPPPAYPAGQPSWAQQAYAQGAYAQPAPPQTAELPGGYAQPVYPVGYQPAYQPPTADPRGGYPQPGHPGYPQPDHPGYPQPGYAGYPGPVPVAGPVRPHKPGVVTASAVLSFTQGGILVFAGIFTLNGATALSDLDIGVTRGYDGLLTTLGILALVSAGLLIAGGVSAFSKKPWLMVAGCVISLLLSVWWAVQFDFFGVVLTWALLLAVMPIISISLILGTTSKEWMRSETQ